MKLLAWKVKTKQNVAQIHAIHNRNREKQILTSDILQAFVDYYTTLYSSSQPDLMAIRTFKNNFVPHLKLTEDHAKMLDNPVTPEEIQAIIKSLKTSKSPGLDGFGAEFHKVYVPKLASQLALTFNEILSCGEFPPSWNEAAIVVLPKKTQSLTDQFHSLTKTIKSLRHFLPGV